MAIRDLTNKDNPLTIGIYVGHRDENKENKDQKASDVFYCDLAVTDQPIDDENGQPVLNDDGSQAMGRDPIKITCPDGTPKADTFKLIEDYGDLANPNDDTSYIEYAGVKTPLTAETKGVLIDTNLNRTNDGIQATPVVKLYSDPMIYSSELTRIAKTDQFDVVIKESGALIDVHLGFQGTSAPLNHEVLDVPAVDPNLPPEIQALQPEIEKSEGQWADFGVEWGANVYIANLFAWNADAKQSVPFLGGVFLGVNWRHDGLIGERNDLYTPNFEDEASFVRNQIDFGVGLSVRNIIDSFTPYTEINHATLGWDVSLFAPLVRNTHYSVEHMNLNGGENVSRNDWVTTYPPGFEATLELNGRVADWLRLGGYFTAGFDFVDDEANGFGVSDVARFSGGIKGTWDERRTDLKNTLTPKLSNIDESTLVYTLIEPTPQAPAEPPALTLIPVQPLFKLPNAKDNFQLGKYNLSAAGKQNSDALAKAFKTYIQKYKAAMVPIGQLYAAVIGHASPDSKDTTTLRGDQFIKLTSNTALIQKRIDRNQSLSDARSGSMKSAIDFGLSKLGILTGVNVCNEGRGETQPLDKNGKVIVGFNPHEAAQYPNVDFVGSRRVKVSAGAEPQSCHSKPPVINANNGALAGAIAAELTKKNISSQYDATTNQLVVVAKVEYKDATSPKAKRTTEFDAVKRALTTVGKKFKDNNLNVTLMIQPSVESDDATMLNRAQVLSDKVNVFTNWPIGGSFSLAVGKSTTTLQDAVTLATTQPQPPQYPSAKKDEIAGMVSAAETIDVSTKQTHIPVDLTGEDKRYYIDTAISRLAEIYESSTDPISLVVAGPVTMDEALLTSAADLYGSKAMDLMGESRIKSVHIVRDERVKPGFYLLTASDLTAQNAEARFKARYTQP